MTTTAITFEDAMAQLRAAIEPGRAEAMIVYHKQTREVLGVGNEVLNRFAKDWRKDLDVPGRVDLARALWDSDIFEARILAAKLLTQARIKDDAAAWDLLIAWVPEFDSWAIADHACSAISKRLVAQPARLDVVETWTKADHMWSRRAALVATLPWAKLTNPKAADEATRDRILDWAATYVADRDWFIQKAVGWWLRDLSKHAPDRTRTFLEGPGATLKAFALKEAAKYLK